MSVTCRLCDGTGDNKTGVRMDVNDGICPRCGGYGTVPNDEGNADTLTAEDNEYIDANGRRDG